MNENGHPIYEYMVGDTVINLSDNVLLPAACKKKPFIVKTATTYEYTESQGFLDTEPYYQGFMENLERHWWHRESELRTCRMVIVEKLLIQR